MNDHLFLTTTNHNCESHITTCTAVYYTLLLPTTATEHITTTPKRTVTTTLNFTTGKKLEQLTKHQLR
jgi:hypothetical protein